jgi:hypothetical protein
MNTKGLYAEGKRHSEGGIPVLVDDVKPIEVEVGEYKLCKSAMQSKKVYNFKYKTNKEILDSLFQKFEPLNQNRNALNLCEYEKYIRLKNKLNNIK